MTITEEAKSLILANHILISHLSYLLTNNSLENNIETKADLLAHPGVRFVGPKSF